jgi:hypothetical protein
MPAARFRVPTTIRLVGELDEAGWARVEDALARQYATVLAEIERRVAGHDGAAARRSEPVRERFDRSRLRPSGYLIPGYDDGDGVAVPTEETGAVVPFDVVRPTPAALREAIRAAFPGSGGAPSPGVFYGIYARMREGAGPMLYYIRSMDTPEVHSILLYRRTVVRRGALRLDPGFYILTFLAGSTGRLLRNGEVVNDNLENPNDLDLTVAFVVDPMRAAPPEPPQWTFYPVTRILATNLESPLGTGAESIYYAVTNIWRVDEQWRPQLISPLAFVGTFPRYHWQINRLPGKKDHDREPRLVRDIEGHDAHAIRHTWKEPGRYEVKCWVTVRATDVSPMAATDRREEEVYEYSLKMALHLNLLAKHQQETGERIWATSAQELIRTFEDDLTREQHKKPPNQAKIDYLTDVVRKLRDQVVLTDRTVLGPFPLHAVFAERKTSQVKPISLFLAFELTGDPDEPYRWHLIDVTYPAFYRTYTGEGGTAVEALLAAFHDSETRFRRTYPPGHILVQVSEADLSRYGIEALTGMGGREFTFETDSWQKDAYEWAMLGVQVVGAAALVAAFVFPPSAVLATILVVTGVAGAALSVANIADRVATNSAYWDTEMFADLANVVASIAQVGSLAVGMRATALAKVLKTAESLTPELTASLNLALKAQRFLLVTQLGTDAVNALIIGYGAYDQLSTVDAEFDEESLKDYLRAYGIAEGHARWQRDRQNRITGILAQAVVGGTLVAVSARGGVGQYGQVRAGERALAKVRLGPPPPPPEAGTGTPPQPSETPTGRPTEMPRVPSAEDVWLAYEEQLAREALEPAPHWYETATDEQLIARAAQDPIARGVLEARRGPDRPPTEATPPPFGGELLAAGAHGPPARWNSVADLASAAQTDPAAGQDLAWYGIATDAQLLAREAADPVARALLDERFGGTKRPYAPDRPANVAIQERLKGNLDRARAKVEAERERLMEEGVLERVELDPSGWGKRRTKGGRQAVPPTAKQLQGFEGTLAAATSEIPALAGDDFVGGSPRALGSSDPAHPIRPGETVTVPQAHGHAEQDIGQQLHDRLARLTPDERAAASGRAVWIRVDQEVCSICAAGLGGTDRTGVLRKLSELNPDILFVVTADDTSKVYRLLAGKGLP